jgi:hypothetical protein
MTDNVVPGAVEKYQEVNILPRGVRIGHGERRNAIKHILDMQDRGYITEQEADARVKAVQSAEKQGDIVTLTTDLPAPFHKPGFFEAYDWDETRYWAPTLVVGMALSAMLAIVPASVFGAEHMFPQTGLGLGVALPCLVFGIVGFFSCLAGIIAKS